MPRSHALLRGCRMGPRRPGGAGGKPGCGTCGWSAGPEAHGTSMRPPAAGAQAGLPLLCDSGRAGGRSGRTPPYSAWRPCLAPLEVWVEGRFCLCRSCRGCSGTQFFVPLAAPEPPFGVLLTSCPVRAAGPGCHRSRFLPLTVLDFSVPPSK